MMAAREGKGRTGRDGIGHRWRTGTNQEPGQECTVARVFSQNCSFGSEFEAPLVKMDLDPDSTLLPSTF
jgi:hypothetical protein